MLLNESTFIYEFVDAEESEVLYIGVTTNLVQRLKSHRSKFQFYCPIVIRIMEIPYEPRYRIESALIKRHKPKFNHVFLKYNNEFSDMDEHFQYLMTIPPGFWTLERNIKSSTGKTKEEGKRNA